MKKIFLLNTILIFKLFASNNSVDCIILEDEDSIVCKYIHTRVSYDHNISVKWIDPNKNISRQRDMTIPAFHGSIYDYRYIKGRMQGVWTFEVIDNNTSYKTNFKL